MILPMSELLIDNPLYWFNLAQLKVITRDLANTHTRQEYLLLLQHKRGSTSKSTANQLLNQFLIRYLYKITKSWIHTKLAKSIKSYFINCAFHKHFNYIFVNRSSYFFIKVFSDLKVGHFYFFRLPLTSATSEAGWKTSNFNVNFNVEKGKNLVYLYEKL